MALEIGVARTDHDKAQEGVWINLSADDLGYVWWVDGEMRPVPEDAPVARLRVARSQNREHKEYLRTELRKHRRFLRGREMPQELNDKITREAVAHTVLRDWEGVEFDGKKPKYKPEIGAEVMKADEDFFEVVVQVAQEAQLYREEEIAEAADTLGKS